MCGDVRVKHGRADVTDEHDRHVRAKDDSGTIIVIQWVVQLVIEWFIIIITGDERFCYG